MIMFVFIALMLIGFIIFISALLDGEFQSLIIGIVMCSLGVYGIYKVETLDPYSGHYVRYRTDYIINLNDTTSLSGSRYYFSENNEYKYYKKEQDGFKFGSVPSYKSRIYYIEDGGSPRIEVMVNKLKTDALTTLLESTISQKVRYDIYIPKGSISNSFEIDNKNN